MTDSTTRLDISEIVEGQEYSETVCLGADAVAAFIGITQDSAPVHTDLEHARRLGFPNLVVHGFLAAAPYSRLLGMFLPGGNSVIHNFQLDLVSPAYVGESLVYTVQVARVVPAVRTVLLRLSASKQDGTIVNRGQATCVFRA